MPFIDTPETNALKSKVERILVEIPEFTDENKNLKINVIKDYAERGDIKLLEPLLKNEQTKKSFFKPVLDSFVFNTTQFKEFLEYSSACNSYSKYLGKEIGLYTGDSSLQDRNEVVLNFPFKDCVLEGGQRKEDGLDTYYEYDEKKNEYTKKQSKRREIFYNEVLARDEIDQLFFPKAFCNAKRYEKGNTSFCTKLNRDAELNKKRGLAENTITDNLIIKGNNLLALHSLKKEFAGKIKLIYIDPPYNTGNDGFTYNDNFNHSSWLTFMKNRLEVARELLREDGAIFVQCDDNEQAYLKVLMDEIFGRENFISNITCKVKSAGGLTTDTEMFFDCAEYLIAYSKNIQNLTYNNIKVKTEIINSYSKTAKQYNNIINNIQYDKKEFVTQKDGIKYYKIAKGYFNIENLPIKQMSEKDFYDKRNEIFRLTALSGGIGKKLKRHIEDFINNDDLFIFEYSPTKGKDKNKLTQYLMYKNQTITMLNKLIEVDSKRQIIEKLEPISNIFADDFWQGISNEGQIKLKNGKKPESLLKRILEISTIEGDLIMDFFAGSGTSLAVAHKMNRQYIGIEQLNYEENDSVIRLQNVINGDQTGISKSLNWQGGGSFVYLELARKNEMAIEQISACESLEDLKALFDELCSKYFLHYNVRIKEFRKEIENERFKQLNLKQQKEMFCRMLDLNQLYVNSDDRHDINTGLSKNDIAVTEDFYQLKNA